MSRPATRLLPLLLLAAGCGAEPVARLGGLEIHHPAATISPAGMAAAYLEIRNRGPADTLFAVTSPQARRVAVHRQERRAGLVRMEPVAALLIPPGGSVRLEPGGTHLMLEELIARPHPGDTLVVVLRFRRAGGVAVRTPVRALTDLEEER